MNYKMIVNVVGKIMILLGLMMILPLIVSLIYQEKLINILAFLIPIVILLGVGYLLCFKRKGKSKIGVREGLLIASLTWLLISLFGCTPFIISGEIPNFFDAFFEMVSGFTTTGSSIVENVEELSYSILFWRSFSHWIGGMGILVFILALIPESKDGTSMHILRAESPGPQVGKLVSKMKVTSRILYLIYTGLTILQILLLYLGPDEKMELFNSIIYSLGTAGTGGFSMDVDGLAGYTAYSQYVIAIFMIIFAINFTIYYLMIIGNFKEILRNDEVKVYLLIVLCATLLISVNVFDTINTLTAEESFRHALFQVASLISTTGYASIDFNYWSSFSKIVLIIVMVFGGCAGSTAGGVKISRVVILFKTFIRKIKQSISPRKVLSIKMDGKTIDDNTIEGTQSFIIAYFVLLIACALIISLDGFDLETNMSASLTCISNVGPGFSVVGPMGNFSGFSNLSKFVLSMEMIAGRLEIFPILALFSKSTWSTK